MTIFYFMSVAKILAVGERILFFGSWGQALVALNKSQPMDCPAGQGRLAVSERWPLVQVRL